MTFLTVKHSISKARYSLGYNRVTLIDQTTGKRYATCGGGYDMLGTCLGEYLQSNHQLELLAIAHHAACQYDKTTGFKSLYDPGKWTKPEGMLYGMTRNTDLNNDKLLSVRLDGACGFDCMVKIARAAGLTVNLYHDKKGNLTSLFVGVTI